MEKPAARPYRSALRAEQADRTRQQIAAAARERFLAAGWARTSVRSVAVAAGVSEATVYAVYGTKAGLALSVVDAIDEAADPAEFVAGLQRAAGDPQAQLRLFVAFDRRLFERGRDVLRMLVEAQRQEPDLAAAYADGRGRGERGRRGLFESWPASVWRAGMTIEQALAVYWILVSFESFEVAVARGWSPAEVEAWWYEVLVRELFG